MRAAVNDLVNKRVAVVIPAYRVREQIMEVLGGIGDETSAIYVVDDACPEGTADRVGRECGDPRVQVIRNDQNLGVGGATLRGYRAAVEAGADIIVKLDGDGQMNPGDIPRLVAPVAKGLADYTKGNRFHELEGLGQMPVLRLAGNMFLSLMAKLSTGYWQLTDPTNGFTAINARLVDLLPLDKVSKGYFFESDLLFRLNLLRCVVQDVPIRAQYGAEKSSLSIPREAGRFFFGHCRNTFKRIAYRHFIRSFSLASVEFVVGLVALGFGLVYGAVQWSTLNASGAFASSGVVMIAGLPIIVGTQLLLSAINYDIQDTPRVPISKLLDLESRSEL